MKLANTASVIPTSVNKAVQVCEKGTSRKAFQCDECDFTSSTVNGVKIHKGTQHKHIQKLEEFHLESPNKSLTLSPAREPREDETETINSQENICLIESPKRAETKKQKIARKQRLELNMSEKEFNDWKQELRAKITKEVQEGKL